MGLTVDVAATQVAPEGVPLMKLPRPADARAMLAVLWVLQRLEAWMVVPLDRRAGLRPTPAARRSARRAERPPRRALRLGTGATAWNQHPQVRTDDRLTAAG